MTSAQTRVGETIDNFYGDSSDASVAANSYRRAVEELDQIAIKELVGHPTGITNSLGYRHYQLTWIIDERTDGIGRTPPTDLRSWSRSVGSALICLRLTIHCRSVTRR